MLGRLAASLSDETECSRQLWVCRRILLWLQVVSFCCKLSLAPPLISALINIVAIESFRYEPDTFRFKVISGDRPQFSPARPSGRVFYSCCGRREYTRISLYLFGARLLHIYMLARTAALLSDRVVVPSCVYAPPRRGRRGAKTE